MYKISFFGHRRIENIRLAEERIEDLLIKLARAFSEIECYVGRDGDFDESVASVLRTVRRRYELSEVRMTLVLPYRRKDMDMLADYYDDIWIPSSCEAVHFKRAIEVRNRCMVDNADLVVAYVEQTSGGAYRALQYAMRCDKKHVNLADMKM